MQCSPREQRPGEQRSLAPLGCEVADCDLHFCLCGSDTSKNSYQRLVSEHMVRHDPVRWRLDITSPLENQCWVFSTCCCCLGWNSLIFSSSDISPTAASHTGWQKQRDGKDGAYTKILHYFCPYSHLFAVVLPPVAHMPQKCSK